jgi:hypothetical protein
VAGDDGLGDAEALFEQALLFGVQIILQRRRDDDLDAHQPVGLRSGDEAARRRAGDTELRGDLGLGEPVQVVERCSAESEPEVLGRRPGGGFCGSQYPAIRRLGRPEVRYSCSHVGGSTFRHFH